MKRVRLGWRHATVAAFAAITVLGAGCGDAGRTAGGDQQRQAQVAAQAARDYAAGVQTLTDRAGTKLAAISGTAAYSEPGSAATTTRAFATTIRTTADELATQQRRAPASVSAQHAQLVALYRRTARKLDRLAERFGAAQRQAALFALAQSLSSEIQLYSAAEAKLRALIEQGLRKATSPAG